MITAILGIYSVCRVDLTFYEGFLKWGCPKSFILIWFIINISKPSILGHLHVWNTPYDCDLIWLSVLNQTFSSWSQKAKELWSCSVECLFWDHFVYEFMLFFKVHVYPQSDKLRDSTTKTSGTRGPLDTPLQTCHVCKGQFRAYIYI